MKERPILFSAAMARAILNGRKTQTRRVVKMATTTGAYYKAGKASVLCYLDDPLQRKEFALNCPYGQPGDRLWVRETWSKVPETAYWHDQSIPHRVHVDERGYKWWAVYKASWERSAPSWKPSIHMPRWASRILLEVVAVRVERLQDITPEDALSEGVDYCLQCSGLGYYEHPDHQTEEKCPLCRGAVEDFEELWQSINGKEPAKAWQANPWVWVVEFRRVADANPS